MAVNCSRPGLLKTSLFILIVTLSLLLLLFITSTEHTLSSRLTEVVSPFNNLFTPYRTNDHHNQHLVDDQQDSSIPSPIISSIPHAPYMNNNNNQVSNEDIIEISKVNGRLMYLYPPVDMLVMLMSKSGSSSILNWLYVGITGLKKWDNRKCRAYVHTIGSPCWSNYGVSFSRLPISRQRKLLFKRTKTLKVAIQRNPYERLISAYMSKFTCDDKMYSTDVHDRSYMVPRLLQLAAYTKSTQKKGCLNISEFATALSMCSSRFSIENLRLVIDQHIQPQHYFFNIIDYDMVIDVNDLSDETVMTPIANRLPFNQSIKPVPRRRHVSKAVGSGDSDDIKEVSIPKDAETKLRAFAMHSIMGELKYINGFEPTTPWPSSLIFFSSRFGPQQLKNDVRIMQMSFFYLFLFYLRTLIFIHAL